MGAAIWGAQPSPARTQSAYRLYSDEDVLLLQRMRDLSREGMSPAQVAEVVRSRPQRAGQDIGSLRRDHRVLAAVESGDGNPRALDGAQAHIVTLKAR